MEASGQLHAPAALPPRKEPPVPIGQEASCYIKGAILIEEPRGYQLLKKGSLSYGVS
jgi:hypothetical protein